MHNNFDKLGFQWQPTFFTNVPRILMGKPILLDYDQYWQHQLIQKYLPDISEEQYVSKRNNIVSQINSTKGNQLLLSNWKTIAENVTSQKISRVRLGQGYFSSDVKRT